MKQWSYKKCWCLQRAEEGINIFWFPFKSVIIYVLIQFLVFKVVYHH